MSVIFYKIIGSILNLCYFVHPRYTATKALLLFSTPRRKSLSIEKTDFLDTAFKEELKYGESHIMTYRWLGQRECILLVHGWESDASRWRAIAKQLLDEGYGLIALDAPAHGRSGYKTFDAFLYSEFINVVYQRYNPTILIAHSVGSFAAMIADATFKLKEIKKMVILGSPIEFSSIYRRYIRMMGYHRYLVKRISHEIQGRFGTSPEEISILGHLENVTSRLLVIHDKEDEIIPYSEGISEKLALKNAEIYTTNGLGHSLEDNLVHEKIRTFLTST